MLAKKWMELKEKNIQQLSQGWAVESSERESFGIGGGYGGGKNLRGRE